MAIHEAGHDHASGGIRLARAAGSGKLLDAARGTGRCDDPILNEHRAVGDDSEVAQGCTTARSVMAAQSE